MRNKTYVAVSQLLSPEHGLHKRRSPLLEDAALDKINRARKQSGEFCI